MDLSTIIISRAKEGEVNRGCWDSLKTYSLTKKTKKIGPGCRLNLTYGWININVHGLNQQLLDTAWQVQLVVHPSPAAILA